MFVNLTPHEVVLYREDGKSLVLASKGIARVDSTPGVCREVVDGIPIYEAPVMGEVYGLPAPIAGTVYIVSGVVAGACKGRADVVYPGTGPKDGAVRDAQGRVIGVTRLIDA